MGSLKKGKSLLPSIVCLKGGSLLPEDNAPAKFRVTLKTAPKEPLFSMKFTITGRTDDIHFEEASH